MNIDESAKNICGGKSINVKKYTKDQMAKMVEDAEEKFKSKRDEYHELAEQFNSLKKEIVELRSVLVKKNQTISGLKAENAALTEQIDQMNGEAINKANEIANLKADLDSAKNSAQYLNDQGQQYWRAWQASKREVADLKNKLADTEAALGRANDDLAFKGTVIDVMRNRQYNAEQRANYAESHPWRNLWAWVKRKLVRHE